MSPVGLIVLACFIGTVSASPQQPFGNRPFAWSVGPDITPHQFPENVSFAPNLPPKSRNYSSVVVFGASYADNAHPRAAEYNFTFKAPPYFGGRYSNGPVFDEYTAKALQAKLINYAYAGAQANNSLTAGYVPSTRDQVNQYISDIGTNAIDRGNGSVLHIWWIGMNPMKAIISTAIVRAALLGNLTAYNEALARVEQEIAEVINQVKTIRESSVVTTLPTHIILLPIPALELIPDMYSIAAAYSDGTMASINANLNLVTMLTDYYNLGLMMYVARNRHPDNHSGCLKTYDIPMLWRELYSAPAKFHFKETVIPCYNSTSGAVCAAPNQSVQWDSWHPTTKVHKHVGRSCAKLALTCL